MTLKFSILVPRFNRTTIYRSLAFDLEAPITGLMAMTLTTLLEWFCVGGLVVLAVFNATDIFVNSVLRGFSVR
jgi:hypothetical protein